MGIPLRASSFIVISLISLGSIVQCVPQDSESFLLPDVDTSGDLFASGNAVDTANLADGNLWNEDPLSPTSPGDGIALNKNEDASSCPQSLGKRDDLFSQDNLILGRYQNFRRISRHQSWCHHAFHKGANPSDACSPPPDYSHLDIQKNFEDFLQQEQTPDKETPPTVEAPARGIKAWWEKITGDDCPAGLQLVCCKVSAQTRPRPAQCVYCTSSQSIFWCTQSSSKCFQWYQ